MAKKKTKKNTIRLTPEERAIERAIERGAYVPVKNRATAVRTARAAARNTFAKHKTINVRISERDLVRLRARAHKEGVPYQTIISSLIRRAVK